MVGKLSSSASSRHKGWGWVDEWALCLSSFGVCNPPGYQKTPMESRCREDKQKAPTRPRIRPLSLQDGGPRHYDIRLSKIIRVAINRVLTLTLRMCARSLQPHFNAGI